MSASEADKTGAAVRVEPWVPSGAAERATEALRYLGRNYPGAGRSEDPGRTQDGRRRSRNAQRPSRVLEGGRPT